MNTFAIIQNRPSQAFQKANLSIHYEWVYLKLSLAVSLWLNHSNGFGQLDGDGLRPITAIIC